MAVFVLVPGACHGGWWLDPLVEVLEAEGHEALPLTLAGLGPEGLTAGEPVNLASHTAEVVTAVRDCTAAAGEGVVLVGHSYAGSVITGAADQVPELVRALVYLDAWVPEDGESGWQLTNDLEREWFADGARATGTTVEVLPFFDERARPHPLACFMQGASLTGAWRQVPVKHYAEATDWPDGDSPMATTVARVRDDPEFTHVAWDHRHNVLFDGPDLVADYLRVVVAGLTTGM